MHRHPQTQMSIPADLKIPGLSGQLGGRIPKPQELKRDVVYSVGVDSDEQAIGLHRELMKDCHCDTRKKQTRPGNHKC